MTLERNPETNIKKNDDCVTAFQQSWVELSLAELVDANEVKRTKEHDLCKMAHPNCYYETKKAMGVFTFWV